VAQLLHDLDPTVVLLVATPLVLAAAAWALRMACSICSVDPPGFWQATFSVIVIAIANIVLRFWLNVTDATPGLASQLFAPMAISAAIVSASAQTGPFSAMMVTIVHGLLCVMCYLAVTTVGSALMAATLF